MESKYLIFICGSAFVVPLGILAATKRERLLNMAFFLLIFGTTQPESFFGLPSDINFLSREWYRGSTRGIEISYLDLLAIIVLVASKAWRRREGVPSVKPPSFGLMKVYFWWAALSVGFVSTPAIFGMFELTKMLRAMVIFLAVAAFLRSDKQVKLFLMAIVATAIYEALVAIFHRYGLGRHRIYGTLPHPNSLSMYCLQIFPICLSIWFANDLTGRLRILALIASALMAGTIVLTISRTGFATLVVLSVLTVALNVRTNLTFKNIALVGLIAIAGAGVTYKAWDSLSSRFSGTNLENEYMTDDGDRGRYFRKGWPAIEEHPVFGVGLNNWSYWVSNKYSEIAGYSSEKYLSLDRRPFSMKQEAPAHNLYLLTLVELGVVGLVMLLVIFTRWVYISCKGIFEQTGPFVVHVRIGLFLSLLAVLMQSVTEWELRQTPMFFLLHILMAVSSYLYMNRMQKSP